MFWITIYERNLNGAGHFTPYTSFSGFLEAQHLIIHRQKQTGMAAKLL
jgi:hypothetical protein